jgi:cAMP phosphodiesterase
MKFQLLPSTFDENGRASARQHLTCFVIDDVVAFDAGSLAMSASNRQREQIRNIILTHAHLDHIAGLPLFVDDLFATLTSPIIIHSSPEVIEILQNDIFNWDVYPDFSDLENEHGKVLEYRTFEAGRSFEVRHLNVTPLAVNHKVPTNGFIIDDGESMVALTGDTAETSEFWPGAASAGRLSAILIECAFPNEMEDLAAISHHLTPKTLIKEIDKFPSGDRPIYLINLKPMYRETNESEVAALGIPNLSILEVGKVYDL